MFTAAFSADFTCTQHHHANKQVMLSHPSWCRSKKLLHEQNIRQQHHHMSHVRADSNC
jgi:hypothetical protein